MPNEDRRYQADIPGVSPILKTTQLPVKSRSFTSLADCQGHFRETLDAHFGLFP